MRRNFALTSLLLESSNVRRHETAQHASHRGACHDSFVYQILSLFVQRFDKFSCPCKKTCCVSTFESSDKKFSRGRGISVKLSTGLIFCSFFCLVDNFRFQCFFREHSPSGGMESSEGARHFLFSGESFGYTQASVEI